MDRWVEEVPGVNSQKTREELLDNLRDALQTSWLHFLKYLDGLEQDKNANLLIGRGSSANQEIGVPGGTASDQATS